MNTFLTNIANVAKNWHVSIPLLLAIGCEAGGIWIPSHKPQFDATYRMLVVYGVVAAANSGPAKP